MSVLVVFSTLLYTRTPSFILRLVSMNDETCHNSPHVPTPIQDQNFSCLKKITCFGLLSINQPEDRRFVFVLCLIDPNEGVAQPHPVSSNNIQMNMGIWGF